MNAQPIPHIGATRRHRAVLRNQPRRVIQPEPVQMCAAVEDDEPLFTRAEIVIFLLLGLASVGIYIAHSAGVL